MFCLAMQVGPLPHLPLRPRAEGRDRTERFRWRGRFQRLGRRDRPVGRGRRVVALSHVEPTRSGIGPSRATSDQPLLPRHDRRGCCRPVAVSSRHRLLRLRRCRR